jgi:hypothetical protein
VWVKKALDHTRNTDKPDPCLEQIFRQDKLHMNFGLKLKRSIPLGIADKFLFG